MGHELSAERALPVRWSATDCHPDERAAAARDAIAILLRQPLQADRGRSVLRCARAAPAARLSYVQAPEHFAYDGRIGPARSGSARPMGVMEFLVARGRNPTRAVVASPRGELQRWWRVKHSITPGRGGRPRRKQAFSTDDALRAVIDQHGEPQSTRSANGGRLYVWELDPLGDGLVLARLSGRELQKGETVSGQAEACLRMCREDDRRVRWLVISLNTSGFLPFERRMDFAFVDEQIRQGTCRWIAVRAPDRIARERLPLELFFQMLRDDRVALLVSQMGGQVDWERDGMQLDAMALIARQEGRLIRQRTHDAIYSRYLEQGRGWPGSVRFGCQRNPDTHDIEECPEQMEVVHWLVQRYLTQSRAGTASLRSLRQELWDRKGCRLSHERIKQILIDPLYVTGEWFTEVGGYAIEGKPVEFAHPVSPADHLQVRQYLAVRQSNNETTPLGHFLANYVPFIHARCADEQVERIERRRITGQAAEDVELGVTEAGQDAVAWSRPMLRGYRNPGRLRECYRHKPRNPDCCKGWPGVDRDLVDRAIVRGLRALADSEELQAAYERSAQQTLVAQGGASAEADAALIERRELLQQIDRQAELVARGERDFLAGSRDGTLSSADVAHYLEEPRHELERLQTALEVAERRAGRVAAERRRTPTADRGALSEMLAEVLTDDVPDDPDVRLARAALVRALLSYIELRDTDGGFELILHGPFIPATGRRAPVKPFASPEVQQLLRLHRTGGVAAIAQATEWSA